MKKFGFLFMIICILALSINICYAAAYDNELYGEVNQTEFELAVLNGGKYSITIETENNINSISIDDDICTFNASQTGYKLNAELTEGVHSLSLGTEDESFCAEFIKISAVKDNKKYFINSEEYTSSDFTSDRIADTIEVDGETIEIRNFEDKSGDANGRFVSFEFIVEDEGLYSVVSYIGKDDNRWTSANSSYIDGVRLELESTTEENIVGDTAYITEKVFSNIELSAGKHTMRIEARARNNGADYSMKYGMTKLEFLGGDEDVASTGLAEIKIQAENYTSVSQDILNADKKVINPVASIVTAEGGAAIRINTTEVPNNGGYSFVYDINVPKSGLYSFYIHGGTTTSRYISPYEYSINDGEFVSVNESFTRYKDSEVEGYADLAGHHYHMNGVYLEEGNQKLTIRCSSVRSSDSSTYYLFLDSMTLVEAGVAIRDIENAELGEVLEIDVDAALPGKARGDIEDTTVEYSSTNSGAISIKDGIITVNGGGMATVNAKLVDTSGTYKTSFDVNTTIGDIGVCESKLMSDGSFGAVVKNYGQEKKSFCCVKIQREETGIIKEIELKDYTLSAGGTVVTAIEEMVDCKAEMFLISSQSNYAPVSYYLNN